MSPFGRTAMLTFLICGCARARAHPEISEVPVSAVREQGQPPAQSGSVLRLYHDVASALSQPVRKVVMDSAGWAEAWALLREGPAKPGPLPVVDFSRHMVVMVAFGQKATTGYDIAVDSIAVTKSEYLIFVRSTDPDNCMVGGMVTQPVDVARISRSGLPVRFIEKIEKLRC